MSSTSQKVSIIIPVYNGSNFLAEAIDSALGQSYDNKEIIVINDGSNDNGETDQIAKSYGERIIYHFKNNGGVASALNLGIQKMTGEYFSWLSHDDLYAKTKIEDQISYLNSLEKNDNVIVACNSSTIYDNGLKRNSAIDKDIFNRHFDIFLSCSAKVGLNGCSLLIPVTALKDAGGFNESLPVTQDYDLWRRLSKTNTFKLLDKQLVMYRDHPQQDSLTKADLSLISGDTLRSEILGDITDDEFALFMNGAKSNRKWLWKNYDVYKQRGYLKTANIILARIALYTRDYEPNNIDQFMKLNAVRDISVNKDINVLINELKALVLDVDRSSYNAVRQSTHSKNSLNRYIDSAKADGIGFLLQKAMRKVHRMISRR